MSAAAASKLAPINAFIRKHFVHIISCVALVGFLTPGLTSSIRAHKALHGQLDASGLSLFFMMLSAAIQCSFGAFRSVVMRPRALLAALGLYFVALPAACWLVGLSCVPLLGRSLGEPLQIGLELVVLMPVAATSAIWVRDAKGDIELLVSLVVITMSMGTLTAPAYLYYMNGFAANSIHISPMIILHQLMVGVLVPLGVGLALNKLLRKSLAKIQPWFTLMGSTGLFMAVYLNVGTAAPLLKRLSWTQIGLAMVIVLAVNMINFTIGSLVGRLSGLNRSQQVTTEFSSGMRSNGTALVVGLASFPTVPLVTVPAAIYIIFQHLVASVVKSRLAARYGEGDLRPVTPPARPITPVPATEPARRAA